MSPKPTAEEPEPSTEAPAKSRPGEIARDEQREDRGVVYHGADWDKAEEEHGRVALDTPAEEEVEREPDE